MNISPRATPPALVVLLALCALLPAASRGAAPGRVDYGRDVLPILSDKCYHCHGPDEAARKAKLRLDTREGAFHVRKDGAAVVVPGEGADSELVRRVTSSDPDEVMPPPKSNRTLTPGQIDVLKRWVDQGAAWGTHWAFVPPRRAAPPEAPAQLAAWPRNAIDRFVLARLSAEGLAPSPEAKKETLLRRAALDLTGLPPTPAEVDAFLADASPDAYDKALDRLLAGPRYGERMAGDWLDLARYADTHGYQMDRYRPMWPYRDWVISAFNRNLPFDQFVTWQLAGDLLPSPPKEQRLATAFNRLHMQNEEGGIVEEEFRVAYVVDRVDTAGTAFLGLTFECCRCHDHKFDPITQKDFYSMFAIFQNIDESGQTSYFTDSTPVPTVLLSDDATDAKLAGVRQAIAAKETQLRAARESSRPAFEAWLKARPATVPATVPATRPVAAFAFDDWAGGKVANAIDPKLPGNAVEGPEPVEGRDAGAGKAAELGGDNGFTFPGVGHFSRADAFSLSLWLRPADRAPRYVVAHHSKAPIDAGSRGYELLLENGRVAFGLHHMWPGNSLKVATRRPIPEKQWSHVAVTYDGSSRAAGVRVYLDGLPAETEVVRDNLYKDVTYGGREPDLAVGYRFRDNGFKGGRVDDFRVFDRALAPLEAAGQAGRTDAAAAWATVPQALTPPQRDGLLDLFLADVDPAARKLADELHALRRQESALADAVPEAMAMRELPRPKPAYVLKRGAYDAPGEEVAANTPGFLPPLPPGEPRDRLGLARWLLSPQQPLTARVIVNRAWQQMFGRGLVETSDNFGSQGSPPTHPELLDYLAVEFREGGWDMKKLLKLIAASAAYRQSSRAAPDLLARDPANVLYARGPSRRLTAEMLRDQALADAGLLVESLGGPSVKPYQPEGLWDVAMGRPHYDQGHGNDLRRRSLYTYWKRTVPPPAMMALDAADRSYCTARRQSTSTPLQALALLNDVQVVEAARFVSQRMLKEGGPTADSRVAWAFRLITDRAPTGRELVVLRQLFHEQRELFAADATAAAKLLAVGEAKNDPALDRADLAAGAVLAEAIFNHDEAMMRR